MEPPVAADADSIRDEKFKVLSGAAADRPRSAAFISRRADSTRPARSTVKPVPGYREEPDVNPKSNTETYAAVKLYIDNWRWAGVPFYLRSGKRLARKNSARSRSASKTFRTGSSARAGDAIEHNALVMKIQPEEGVSIRFSAKVPGPKMHIRSVSMDFNYGTGFGVVSAPAYERLIGDAMRGDATLFTRWDAVEAAWEAVMPILEKWQMLKDTSFPNYAAGSQGPVASDALFDEDDGWRRI